MSVLILIVLPVIDDVVSICKYCIHHGHKLWVNGSKEYCISSINYVVILINGIIQKFVGVFRPFPLAYAFA